MLLELDIGESAAKSHTTWNFHFLRILDATNSRVKVEVSSKEARF